MATGTNAFATFGDINNRWDGIITGETNLCVTYDDVISAGLSCSTTVPDNSLVLYSNISNNYSPFVYSAYFYCSASVTRTVDIGINSSIIDMIAFPSSSYKYRSGYGTGRYPGTDGGDYCSITISVSSYASSETGLAAYLYNKNGVLVTSGTTSKSYNYMSLSAPIGSVNGGCITVRPLNYSYYGTFHNGPTPGYTTTYAISSATTIASSYTSYMPLMTYGDEEMYTAYVTTGVTSYQLTITTNQYNGMYGYITSGGSSVTVTQNSTTAATIRATFPSGTSDVTIKIMCGNKAFYLYVRRSSSGGGGYTSASAMNAMYILGDEDNTE